MSFSGVDESGWFDVEKPGADGLLAAEVEWDRSIWVYFSKKMGDEKILASFPDEPTYRYTNGGASLEAFARTWGVEYRMQVQPVQVDSAQKFLSDRMRELKGVDILQSRTAAIKEMDTADIAYRDKGVWVFETWVFSPNHTYLLQTKSVDLDDSLHQKFVASFDVSF